MCAPVGEIKYFVYVVCVRSELYELCELCIASSSCLKLVALGVATVIAQRFDMF